MIPENAKDHAELTAIEEARGYEEKVLRFDERREMTPLERTE